VVTKRSTKPVSEFFKIKMIPILPIANAVEPRLYKPDHPEVKENDLDFIENESGYYTVKREEIKETNH
jgi:hypothetical protein